MFCEQRVLGISENRKKISKSKTKYRQFPRKVYLNEFFCSHITGRPTTLPINELLNMYISRILPIFSEYKRREFFLEN